MEVVLKLPTEPLAYKPLPIISPGILKQLHEKSKRKIILLKLLFSRFELF